MALGGQPSAAILDTIYEAARAPAAWRTVVDALEARYEGFVALWSLQPDPIAPVVGCSNACDARVDAYVDGLWRHDAGMGRLVTAPAGTLFRDSVLVDDAHRRRSPFYGGYLGALGTPRGLYASVMRDGEASVVIGVHRPAARGDYSDAEMAELGRLLPHLERSLRLGREIEQAQLAAGAAVRALEFADIGVVLTDADARLRYANPVAEGVLAGAGLAIVDGRVEALRHQGTRALHKAIARAAARRDVASTKMSLPLPDFAGAISIMVSPAGDLPRANPAERLVMLTLGRRAAPRLTPDQLRSTYGLTPAEARLLSALVSGERLADYAARSGIAVQTARTHLGRLFAKTGTKRQADLIRVALADPVLRMRTGDRS